jgi:hypothetical protein
MKNHFIKSFFAFAIISGMLTSCNLFDKADDVKFDSPIEGSLSVNATNVGSVTENLTLSSASSPEINKYKDKIRKFTVNKVTYTIVDYLGEADCLFSGSVKTSIANSATLSLTDVNIKQLNDAGTATELVLPANDLQAIAALLKEDKEVIVTVTGSLTKIPASFKIKFTINATIEADALK